MKSLVLYHDRCADGFAAAFAAWLFMGDDAEYIPAQYGYASLPDFKDRDVYVLDFSLKPEHMRGLFAVAAHVTWLDHHKGSRPVAAELLRTDSPSPRLAGEADNCVIVHDNDKSGALLAWEHFHPQPAPLLFRHVDDYDRWQFKLRLTRELNGAVWSYTPWTFEQWRDIFMADENYGNLCTEGIAIRRAREQNVLDVVRSSAMPCNITAIDKTPDPKREHRQAKFLADERGLAANCPAHLSSDVGHALAAESGTFGLLWRLDKGGKCLCSLRSNGDYDVSAIAKVFDGGGHRNAAGFEVPIQTLLSWLQP